MAEDAWNTLKSTHFVVFYKNAPEDFVKLVTDKAEVYYDQIAEGLGFMRFDFWLWDNRAKIYIYDDAKIYSARTGQPAWSLGIAIPGVKAIETFPYANNFIETVLPHEMGHIIFREFVGFNNSGIPLWLDEGVASHQEKAKYSQVGIFIRKAMVEGNFMDLKKLASFYSVVNLDPKLVNIFYAESFSLIDFLIREFGRDNFVLFCQNLRDKRNLERAMASVYPFGNINELDQAWQKYLKK